MNVVPTPRLSVDDYLAWADSHPGRYELHDGRVIKMSPENAGHAEVKFAVQSALAAGLRTQRLPCRMLPDGMTVRIDDHTAFEPDALVYCGDKAAPRAVEIPAPVIVVEVLSPSTRQTDEVKKLAGYFRVASIAHYLIVDPGEPLVVHHARGASGDIVTRIVRDGVLILDPPGLTLAIADIYPAA